MLRNVFVADAGAMLDRMNAAFDRDRDSFVAVCVRGDLAAKLCRLFDDRLDFVQVELRNIPDIAVRKHASGRENLDEIGVQLDVLSHQPAKAIRPVGNRAHANAGVFLDPARDVVGVAVATGDRERLAGREHARPDDCAIVDGIADREVDARTAADVANRRKAVTQHNLRVADAVDRRLRDVVGRAKLRKHHRHVV